MTVSTTINSFLLTFGPLIVTYQGLNLKQYNAYPGCFFGAIAFLLTQVAKFIILAIVFPIMFPGDDFGDEEQGGKFVIEQDILRALVSCVDIVGLYFVFQGKRLQTIMGDVDVKIVAVGLGWSAAELATSNFLDIIFQSWSNEMKVEYIMQALSANLDTVEIIALAYLGYALTKRDEGSSKKNLVYILVLMRYLMPVVLRYAREQTKVEVRECDLCYESMFVGAKAVFAGLLYLGS